MFPVGCHCKSLKSLNGIYTPQTAKSIGHAFHIYPVRVKNRDELKQELKENGVGTSIHYSLPVHLQACFSDLGCKRGDFPVAENLAEEELSLPIYPEMTFAQIDCVSDILSTAVRSQ